MANQLGALANLQTQAQPLFDREQERQANADMGSGQLGSAMQPARNPAEFDQRFHENKAWLSDPKTQAALLAFAVNIMQPVGGNGGMGDFVGALGRSLGAGALAARGVEESDLAAQDLARQQDIEDRKITNEERQTDLQSRELDMKEGKAGQRQYSKVVGANDPLNKKFNLGLTGAQQAKVNVTTDVQGNPIAADVEGAFNEQGMAAQVTSGRELGVDANGNKILTEIPGGKAEEDRIAAEQQKAAKYTQTRVQAKIVSDTIDGTFNLIANKQNPDMQVTGIGSYLAYLPGTDARVLQENLKTIKANIGFDKLQQMRENSPTGGALGQVSDFENQLLQSTYASLDQAQPAQQLVNNLQRVKVIYNDIISGGELNAISKMIESGNLSPEQAQNYASKLIDEKLGMPTAAPPDKVIQSEIPDAPPGYMSDEDKANWKYYTPIQKSRIMGGYKARNQDN